MDELKKGLSISVHGPEAEEALTRAYNQIGAWGLVMPKVEPLVLDFGLGDFWNTGEIEFWIANEEKAGYCGKFLFVFDGQTCPTHHHKRKLETFYLVKGTLKVLYTGTRRELQEGDVLRVDTKVDHSFTGAGPALLLEVSKPSIIDDNFFANRRIPIGGNYQP